MSTIKNSSILMNDFISEYLFSIIPIQHSVWLYVVRAVEDSNIQRGLKNETEWQGSPDPYRMAPF